MRQKNKAEKKSYLVTLKLVLFLSFIWWCANQRKILPVANAMPSHYRRISLATNNVVGSSAALAGTSRRLRVAKSSRWANSIQKPVFCFQNYYCRHISTYHNLNGRSYYPSRLFASKSTNDNHTVFTNDSFDRNSSKKRLVAKPMNNEVLDQLRMSLRKHVFSQIFDEDAMSSLKDGKRNVNILLAVSGGCDSVGLLHSIIQIMSQKETRVHLSQPELDDTTWMFDYANNNETKEKKRNLVIECRIHVVHYDHQQRDGESDKDRIFVKQLCEENNVPFYCFYWDDYDAGHELKDKFSQDSARNWRRSKSMELLEKICSNSSISKGVIFTAHHKDDAEETMIMKLLRGVHLSNWSGMDALQQLSSNNGVQLFLGKPMLCLRKKSIKKYLLDQNLVWREDESNETDKYFRNRVRHQLIPVMQDLVGGEDVLGTRLKSIEEQSYIIRKDLCPRADDYLKGCSTSFPLPREGGLDVVQQEALYQWMRRESVQSFNLSYDKMTLINQQIVNFPHKRQWKLSLERDWYIIRNGDILELECPKGHGRSNEKRNNKSEWTVEFTGQKNDSKSETLLDYEESYQLSIALQNPVHHEAIDFFVQKVDGNEALRFIPPWRPESRKGLKIKEFLRGQKLPLHERGSAPILCMKIDEVLHVVAIFVDNGENSRWVINRSFSSEDSSDRNEPVYISLKRKGLP